MKRVVVDPISRIEGHLRVEIKVDEASGIGWLARENKILLRKKEGMLYASIENVEFTFG